MENNGLLKNNVSIDMDFAKVTIISNDKIFLDSMKFNSIGRDENIKYDGSQVKEKALLDLIEKNEALLIWYSNIGYRLLIDEYISKLINGIGF